MISRGCLAALLALLLPGVLAAAEQPALASPVKAVEDPSIAELAERVAESVVVVTHTGRDGKQAGLGTGFIISADGLIATNLHVIGEARPITVRTNDGKEYPVTSVHATERKMDLAIVSIDAKDLPALDLGDSDALKQGEDVVAIGNPLGLKHSVVSGIVSGRREIDGMPMIQLAIPIEAGNSGGPLLDRQGKVHGILTLKSLVTRNLGFAVAINALKPLLEKPNPVPIARWLTIGTLDPQEWTALSGANWRQRAGRIHVEGVGQGFGGRSLLISELKPPEMPYEVAVEVKLEDEDGAAGLIVHADGNEKHYGFYPSGGRVRLSRFDGPDVFNWQVLTELRTPHYRPGEWNRLKVRIDRGRIECFVNDELVIESDDSQYVEGKVGLAKFRDTKAEFRRFQVGRDLPSGKPSEAEAAQILARVAEIDPARPPRSKLIESFDEKPGTAAAVLRERARRLEQQAERLRQLARAVHEEQARHAMVDLLSKEEAEIDLFHAALLIAKIDNDELDVDAYVRTVERMAAAVKKLAGDGADEASRLKALNTYLFDELGFHGSRNDYYNRSNSYLNEVIDDREGLPITLSVLYMELARRNGLNVVGVGLPGHFVVRYEPEEGESRLLDPFEGGKELTREQAAEKVQANTGRPFDEEYLVAQSKRAIVIRMIRNLMGVARDASDAESMLRYVDTVLALEPDSAEDRMLRAVVYYQTGRIDEAIGDTDWLIEKKPEGIEIARVRQLRGILEELVEVRDAE